MAELATMPAGSHIGQLSISLLGDTLPPQFLMHYDYEFLYLMKCLLERMRGIAGTGNSLIAHSVVEELLVYLCNEEAKAFIELSETDLEFDEFEEDWVFDMFEDSMNVYEDDEQAVEAAVADGIRIIPVDELPENFDRRYYGWIDTPENRRAIQQYCDKHLS